MFSEYPLDGGRVSISPADPPSTFEIQSTTFTGGVDDHLLNAPLHSCVTGPSVPIPFSPILPIPPGTTRGTHSQ